MQILGSILISLIGLRLVLSLLDVIRTQRHSANQRRKSLELLDERIASIRALRKQRETQQTHWNGYRKFRVDRKVLEADNICSFYLVPHDGKPLPKYRPGQFLTFRFQLPDLNTKKSKSVVRCYSLSEAPRPGYYRVTVKRVPPPPGVDAPEGRVSNYFHDHVIEGDILDVQSPRGDFFLEPTERSPVVLIGGGVGVTPVLSMANTILETDIQRDVWFFLGVRCGREHPMREHLQQLDEQYDHFHLMVCYSCPEGCDESEKIFHHKGHVDLAVISETVKVCNYDFYICGPPPMMETLVPALKDWGVPKEKIHTEAFGPATVNRAKKSSTPQKSQADSENKPEITVQFSRSETCVTWDHNQSSLLDFALDQGIEIDSGCRAGSCGSCEVAVKQGEIEYTVEPSVEVGRGSCLACIACPKTNLVIEA
ncbi:MAG: 2Fe-2S iron-sulfur cluster-binding protein [Planctomycetaceae bacterium]|jgi:uncharacterized protein|nr:2Fe-2S iron-sulfur cluster-binding protein [Planctomycetaceae bacterium]